MPAHVERHRSGLHNVCYKEQHTEPSITQGVVDRDIECERVAGHGFVKVVGELQRCECVGQLCARDAESPARHETVKCILTGRIGRVFVHR